MAVEQARKNKKPLRAMDKILVELSRDVGRLRDRLRGLERRAHPAFTWNGARADL